MKEKTPLFNAQIIVVLLFLIWFGILGVLYYTDTYQTFLQPKFSPLLLFSIGVLFIFFLAAALKLFKGTHPSKGAMESFMQMGILIIPIVFIYVSFGQSLGVHALSNRMVDQKQGGEWPLLAENKKPALNTEDDIYTLIEINDHAGVLENQRLTTIGALFNDEQLPDNYLLLFRFAIVCCAADAVPVWVLIERKEITPIEDESWAEVTGRLVKKEIDGKIYPVIEEEKINFIPTPGPSGHYLYSGKS